MKVPFLATFTLTEATPLELVLAENVFPFTLIVIFLLETALPLDFNVMDIFLAFLTFNVAFGAFKVVVLLLTMILLDFIEDL